MSEEVVQETDVMQVVINDATKSIEEWAMGNPIHPLKHLKCRVFRRKDGGAADYVLVNGEGKPFYANSSLEAVAVYVDVVAKLVHDRTFDSKTFGKKYQPKSS